MTETGSKVVQNNSFSGSSICNTVREWLDKTSSFLSRFDRLVQECFFQENEVNTVFILGATNDSWSNAPVGEVQFDHFEKQDLYSVLPALCCLIARMQAAIPGVRIVQVVNTGLKDEIVAGMKAASEHFKTDIVFLHDVEKIAGHPTVKGMEQIKDQILEQLAENR